MAEEIKKKVASKKRAKKQSEFVEMTNSAGVKANVHKNNVEKFRDQGYK